MSDFTPSFLSRNSFRPSVVLLALLAALAAAPAVRAADDADQKTFSDKVREGLVKFGPLQTDGKWAEALAVITGLMKDAKPDSYDEYFLYYLQGQIYLRLDQAEKAGPPLEKALAISDEHHFMDPKDERVVLKLLAQLYNSQASGKGVPIVQQQLALGKANTFLKRLIDEERESKTLNVDDLLFYTYLLYNRAEVNPEKPDLALLKQAQKLSEEGLRLSITPKPEFYRLLLSTNLAQGDYLDGAKILELELKTKPDNKDNWTQLAAIYFNLANSYEGKDKDKALEYNVRAIITVERAQEHGFLKTPKDNFNLVGTYYNIGQVGRAAQLLQKGLESGAIESTEQYWTFLSQWYQQVNQDDRALAALKEAASHFPNSGQFDFQAAQAYYAIDKLDDALKESRIAAEKGMGENTWRAWSFIAYTAFNMEKYDVALEAATKALSFPESKKDAQLPQLKTAIEKTLSDRAAQLEAIKAKQKL